MAEREIKKKGPDINKADSRKPPKNLTDTQNTQHNIRQESLGPNGGRNQQN